MCVNFDSADGFVLSEELWLNQFASDIHQETIS